MPFNTSRTAIIAERRKKVASLRLRGWTQREIQRSLAIGNNVYHNPSTGKPFSLGIINSDIKALERQWLAKAADSTDEYKASVLAEIAEVKREAWSQGDLRVVLSALKQEAELVGLNAPQKAETKQDVTIRIEPPEGYADVAPPVPPKHREIVQ